MIEEADTEHLGVALSTVCELFGVSRSWYYRKPKHTEWRAQEDVALRDAIERIVLSSSPVTVTAESNAGSAARGMDGEPQEGFARDEGRIAALPAQEALHK